MNEGINSQFSKQFCFLKYIDNFKKNIHISFRGYVIWNNKLYMDDFITIIKEHFENDTIFKNIRNYNGSFNIIIQREDEIFIFNDRWGTFPIFYIYKKNKKTISDNWQKLINYSNKKLRIVEEKYNWKIDGENFVKLYHSLENDG